MQITPRTMARRRTEGRLTRDESDRVVRAARVFGKALALFEADVEATRHWFASPAPALADRTPQDVATTEVGAREVEALIGPPDPDPPLAPLQEGDRLYMLGPTPWETLRFTVWMLTDDDDELSQSGVGEASSILTWRALVVGFDAQDRLARFEITER